MGWSSGSRIMSKIVDSLKPADINDATRTIIYEQIIEVFEENDCDTLMECLGEDLAFDRAYRNLNPTHDGRLSCEEGKKLTDNPHTKGSRDYLDWQDGWDDSDANK